MSLEVEAVSSGVWDSNDDGTVVLHGEGIGTVGAIRAQGFVAPNSTMISAIRVRVAMEGTPQGSVFLEVYEGTDPDSVGSVLATSELVSESALTEYVAPTNGDVLSVTWPMIEFEFTTPAYSNGDQMFFFIKRTTAHADNQVQVHVFFDDSFPYSDGTLWQFRDDTSTWQQDSDNNIAFQLYEHTLYVSHTGFRFPYPRWT